MNSTEFKWILPLDNEISSDNLTHLIQVFREHRGLQFRSFLALLQSKVPLSPRAFLHSSAYSYLLEKNKGQILFELNEIIGRFEGLTQRVFGKTGRTGSTEKPLLLSIRGDYCGSIRNIGIGPETLPDLIDCYGSELAYSLYIEFLESYSTLVLGAKYINFKNFFHLEGDHTGQNDVLNKETESGFLAKVQEYTYRVSQDIGMAFPNKPEQHFLSCLEYCVRTVQNLEKNEIFIECQLHRSSYEQSVQGVFYTRNPFTGKKELYGVFQNNDVKKINKLERNQKFLNSEASKKTFQEKYPEVCDEVILHLSKIEDAFREVMEAEFIIDETGKLHFTQFHRAETTARASVVSTVELNQEGIISDQQAAARLKAHDIEMLLHPTLDDSSRRTLKDLGSSGLTAAPGTAVGHVFFKMQDALRFYKKGVREQKDRRVILITDELFISDTSGLGMISGLVTRTSGIASHAAVMARAHGIPCLVGYQSLEIHPLRGFCKIRGRVLKAGTLVTLEASEEGRLFQGEGVLSNLSFKEGTIRMVSELMKRVIKKENIPVEIRVNINNFRDAEVGLSFGAAGVGLCRTENMFMEEQPLKEIRNIIFTDDQKKRRKSLQILEEIQFVEFKKIFEVMRHRVVNVRLMDLPLYDFVPQTARELDILVKQLPHLKKEAIRMIAEGLREHNPMLGLRACRFGLTNPEVYNLQIRAFIRAAYSVAEKGISLNPGIMFPLVLMESELTELKQRVLVIESEVKKSLKISMSDRVYFRVGSMIELPAAALGADHLCRVGEFFAFGTNDLTQTTLGMSRDDSAHYLPNYLEHGILPADPFKVLNESVKELIEIAVCRGRRVRADASFGICGEQGGEVSTLAFCLEKKLDYISCSPYRVLPTLILLVKVAMDSQLDAKVGFCTPSVSHINEIDPSLSLRQAG